MLVFLDESYEAESLQMFAEMEFRSFDTRTRGLRHVQKNNRREWISGALIRPTRLLRYL